MRPPSFASSVRKPGPSVPAARSTRSAPTASSGALVLGWCTPCPLLPAPPGTGVSVNLPSSGVTQTPALLPPPPRPQSPAPAPSALPPLARRALTQPDRPHLSHSLRRPTALPPAPAVLAPPPRLRAPALSPPLLSAGTKSHGSSSSSSRGARPIPESRVWKFFPSDGRRGSEARGGAQSGGRRSGAGRRPALWKGRAGGRAAGEGRGPCGPGE